MIIINQASGNTIITRCLPLSSSTSNYLFEFINDSLLHNTLYFNLSADSSITSATTAYQQFYLSPEQSILFEKDRYTYTIYEAPILSSLTVSDTIQTLDHGKCFAINIISTGTTQHSHSYTQEVHYHKR